MTVKVAAAVLLVPLFALFSLPLVAEEALTNQEVLKMVAAGLGDEVVVAKIQEAPRVDFRLEADDLVSLRTDGASERVIQAMLARNHPAPKSPGAGIATHLGMEFADVSLETRERNFPLIFVRGTMSHAGGGWWSATFMNYPGLHARVRTTEKRPVLLVKSTAPPTGRFFLGKLDADAKNGVRSLKISSGRQKLKGAFGSSLGMMSPDPDWTAPFEAVEESEGLWRITPKGSLAAGEYGWYANIGSGPQAMGIFDFGVD